jgi:hypothetical protein
MKNLLYTYILACTFSSCAEGLPGDIYLAITQDGYVTYYLDDNDCVPYGMIYGTYYGPCIEGTYNFEYGITSGAYWYGTYYIYANIGTTGFLFGVDGDDNYFTFYCSYDGSSITNRQGEAVKGKLIKKEDDVEIKEYELPDYTIIVKQTKQQDKSISSPTQGGKNYSINTNAPIKF